MGSLYLKFVVVLENVEINILQNFYGKGRMAGTDQASK